MALNDLLDKGDKTYFISPHDVFPLTTHRFSSEFESKFCDLIIALYVIGNMTVYNAEPSILFFIHL